MTPIKTADAVIIGGGVTGTSLAYYLAQRRWGRILVLEREILGSGSTGRSVASIDLFSLQPAALELQQRAYKTFLHFKEIVGDECGLVTTGFAVLAGVEHESALKKASAQAQAIGIEAHLLTPTDYAQVEPAGQGEGLNSICYVPGGGYADPMLTTQAFASAARRAGVVIQQGQSVVGLSCKAGRVTGVETTSGAIATPVVVLAAGPWSDHLLKTFGFETLGLQPLEHPVISLQRPADFGPPHLSILDLPNQIYARPETGGLTLAGSIEPAIGYTPVTPDITQGQVTTDYNLWTAERLVRRYPSLQTSQLRNGWSGIITASPDWQPVLGKLPEASGLYLATGFSGQGFKISPAVGDLMAGLITGEEEAASLLAPFRPGRFREGQALTLSKFGTLG